MKDLQVAEYSNQRILTTAQIAEAYGTTPQVVTNNFNRNKKHFTEGKHYYCLEGDILKDFITIHQFDLSTNLVNNTKLNKLYLWTENGAWLLAKSLNTDEAWQACETLVDEYYRIKEQLADARATLGELRGMLHAILQGDVDTLAMTKASASLGPAMLNSINAALDILAEEQRTKLFSRLADQQQLSSPKTELRPFDYAPESINARILTTLRILGPGWHSTGTITHAGDSVLESIGIPSAGGYLYRLAAAGVILRKEMETAVAYRLPPEI